MPPMCLITDSYENDQARVTKLVALRASELQKLLGYYHRTNEEGVCVPVSDISYIEGSEGGLRRPSTFLQNMLDCTVPPEEKLNANLSYFSSFSLESIAITL